MDHSCSFVVDLKCASDPNDLQANDNRVWKHSRVVYFLVFEQSELDRKQAPTQMYNVASRPSRDA